jgi:hypothetical protein
MRISSSLLKYDLQLSFYLYIYIIDIKFIETLSFLILNIIFIIFIYKIIYILTVLAYPYFSKLSYHHISFSSYQYPVQPRLQATSNLRHRLASVPKPSTILVAQS